MSVDLSKAMAFESVASFESLATTPGEWAISIYRPERFVLNQKHQVSALSLDALVAILVSIVGAAPNSDGFSPDLDLMMVSVAALSQPGFSEKNHHKPRQTLPRVVCEHSLTRTEADGTPFGGLRRFEDFIVSPLPSDPQVPPGVSSPNPPLPESHLEPGPKLPFNGALRRKRTFGDRCHAGLESLLGSILISSEVSPDRHLLLSGLQLRRRKR